ncbi:dihydropteroate synthase [Melioribacteraceae bacterium 4301-Me]|uniref:dihydropteroate synthase n=1 Tax=Pyranulibacter aquaticus TaxID=3163344 RepID=UPI003597ABA0
MTVQLIDIFYTNVFKRYSVKYNIFRELYEKDLLALEIRNVKLSLAQKVKKIILSNKEICYTADTFNNDYVDLLAIGSISIFKELAKEILAIGNEDLGFKITRTIKNFTEYENQIIEVGGKTFPAKCSLVMGIVNVTPDSFSDGGKYFDKNKALAYSLQLLEDGADIIDIGGESTRPGSEPISAEEELKRVIPVIESVISKKPDAIISIDTNKSIVAEEACKCGAKIINDTSSFSFDEKILSVVQKYKAALILMHMKGTPKNMQENPYYDEVVSEIYDYLVDKVNIAVKEGIKNIFIDPGIGFGKRIFDNYEIIKRLNEFKGIGFPIVIGLSRKSFIGKAFNLEVDKREEPTFAAETIAIKNGAKIIRTHNVKNAKVASKMNYFIENPEQLQNV